MIMIFAENCNNLHYPLMHSILASLKVGGAYIIFYTRMSKLVIYRPVCKAKSCYMVMVVSRAHAEPYTALVVIGTK